MRETPRKPVSVTKRNHPIPDGRLFVVGAATGGDRVSAEGKTGVRRQCAVCSRSGRIASGITLRRLRGGASEALVPECRRCPPATVGALSGGTVAGETRRKGVQYSPVKEITTNTPPNGDIRASDKEKPLIRGPHKIGHAILWGKGAIARQSKSAATQSGGLTIKCEL